jgi:hypothetical protein
MSEVVTESSPLLSGNEMRETREEEEEIAPETYHMLMDLIGARHLSLRPSTVVADRASISHNKLLEPYCVAKFGTKLFIKPNHHSEVIQFGLWKPTPSFSCLLRQKMWPTTNT